jgi:hypothetical protein
VEGPETAPDFLTAGMLRKYAQIAFKSGLVKSFILNHGTTKPAKFLVFFVKQKGAPITVPAK